MWRLCNTVRPHKTGGSRVQRVGLRGLFRSRNDFFPERALRSKKENPDWKFQLLEIFNLAWKCQSQTFRIPHKKRGLAGGSLENLNPVWNVQSRKAILSFFNLWAFRVELRLQSLAICNVKVAAIRVARNSGQPRNYDFRASQFDPPRFQSGNDRETTTSPPGHHWEANVALTTTAKLQQLRVNRREMTTFAESCNDREMQRLKWQVRNCTIAAKFAWNSASLCGCCRWESAKVSH